MSKHTPGGWHRGAGNGTGSIFKDGEGRMRMEAGGTTLYPICAIVTGWDEAEDDANADLIAAAPDLLAALKEIISQIDQGGSGGKIFARDACIASARAAIAKAEHRNDPEPTAKTHKIDIALIAVDGDYRSFKPRTRLMVRGGNVGGYYLGCITRGHADRKVDGGPMVPGPWAYAFALSTVIDDCGGTRGEIDRDRAAGLLLEADYGDQLEIDGVLYTIVADHNEQIKLVPA